MMDVKPGDFDPEPNWRSMYEAQVKENQRIRLELGEEYKKNEFVDMYRIMEILYG